jgi:hypothetical protein
MKTTQENITKAKKTADLLIGDLREAHKTSDSPAMELVLLNMIKTVANIKSDLAYMEVVK